MVQDDDEVITPQAVWQVYRVPIILGLLSLLFIALSITIFIKSYQPETPITFSSDESESSSAAIPQGKDASIFVDIEGAVVRPGVYRLPQGSRIDDVLGFAGGFTQYSDMEAVARLVNRAAIVTDGAKIYIPSLGENAAIGNDGSSGSSVTFVNINSASKSELEMLSGIGAVTSDKIIHGRPYLRIEDLVEKKILSQSLFEKLKDQLVL
ncbi:MAG: helix-hairpin-helix domain-containing protein [Patescibacteria group bacterium]